MFGGVHLADAMAEAVNGIPDDLWMQALDSGGDIRNGPWVAGLNRAHSLVEVRSCRPGGLACMDAAQRPQRNELVPALKCASPTVMVCD